MEGFNRMKHNFFAMILLIAMFCSGCVTSKPFDKIPSDSASFNLPENELKALYPEIDLYEKKFRDFSPNTPLVQSLIDAWGEPDKKTRKYSQPLLMGGALGVCWVLFGPVPTIATGIIVVAIRPYVNELYYWKKENYCIEVYVDKTIANNYKKTISWWEWYELNEKDIPKECKNYPPINH